MSGAPRSGCVTAICTSDSSGEYSRELLWNRRSLSAMNFASDNAAGIAPEILAAIARANAGCALRTGQLPSPLAVSGAEQSFRHRYGPQSHRRTHTAAGAVQQAVVGPQGIEGRIVDAHPRRFADPQDDSIFHPRTWHRAAGCARTLGRLSNHPTRPRRASRGNGAAAANQPRRVMKTIAFVSWQIVDDDDISGPQRWRQR